MPTCTECAREKPAEAFYRRSGGGRRPRCKDCERQRTHGRDDVRCPVCDTRTRRPGICGFCEEERTGDLLTEPAAPPPPRTPHEHRLDVGRRQAAR